VPLSVITEQCYQPWKHVSAIACRSEGIMITKIHLCQTLSESDCYYRTGWTQSLRQALHRHRCNDLCRIIKPGRLLCPLLLKRVDLVGLLESEANVIEAVDEALLAEGVNVERDLRKYGPGTQPISLFERQAFNCVSALSTFYSSSC
jgi:hypothetical protein